MMTIPAFVDEMRRSHGLMTIADIAALVERGNVVFDPFSVLIAAHAEIGTANVFHPCVSIFGDVEVALVIGDRNVFHTNCLIEASVGPVRIGSSNQFGEGGLTAKANRPGARITIGDHGRYLGGASVFGPSELGSGSQILGAITVDGCRLEAGGAHTEPDPDRRAGLLKGAGVARNLTIPAGKVIAGSGAFVLEAMVDQSVFHPKGR